MRWKVALVGLIPIFVFAHYSYQRVTTTREHSHLSRIMWYASQRPTLEEKILYSGAWPPAYPVLLSAAERVGIAPDVVNELLLLTSLAVFYTVSRRCWPTVEPLAITALYAALGSHYLIFGQLFPEDVVVPLSLLIFAALIAYLRRRTVLSLVALATPCALIFPFRYHAALWLLPASALAIASAGPPRRVLRHAALFTAISMPMFGALLTYNYLEKGYITRQPRFDRAARHLESKKGEVRLFVGRTDFDDNLFYTAKTYFVDFASPTAHGVQKVNRMDYAAGAAEYAAVLLFGASLGVCIWRSIDRHGFSAAETWRGLWRGFRSGSPGCVALFMWASYLAITIAAWSVGNNDPIFTRFLYPSYPYFVFSMVAAYAWLIEKGAPRIQRAPFVLLYAVVLFVNLYKVLTHPLPLRIL